jgi:putative ABC transport system permease protein
VKAVAARIKREHPASHASWTARSITARDGMTNSETWLILGLLVATVVMVLLIASANVANIMLARMAGRRREIAVRGALGASRLQIARQILVEGFVLAVIGAAVGLGLAHASIKLLSVMAPGNFLFEMLEVNYRVVGFAIVLAFIAPVFFAVLPAMQSARLQTVSSIGDLGARVAGGRRATRVRGALVVAQIALAMTLMVVAALAVQSIVGLMSIDPGFRSGALAVARFEMPEWRYASEQDIRSAAAAAVDAATAAPGVSRAVITSRVPAIDADVMRPLDVDGVPLTERESRTVGETIAGAGYFEAIGIPLLTGRAFDGRDRDGAQGVAVVSRTTADRYLGGLQQAPGRRIRLGAAEWATVVGVVENTANPDVDEQPNPIVYLPFEQHPARSAVLLAVSAQPEAVPSALRDALRRLDRDIAVEAATFDDLLIQEFAATRVIVALFMAFGGIATLLAASGLYGVVAFVVAQRTREFGVRLALGAKPADVRRLMLSQGGTLIAIGLALGLAGSFGLAQLTRGILYGVSASDPPTYAAIAAIIAVTALAATYVPARRAMRVDPIEALRTD